MKNGKKKARNQVKKSYKLFRSSWKHIINSFTKFH